MVVGSGSWGVVLACHVASLDRPVTLLVRTPEEAQTLRAAGTSPRLSDVPFPRLLSITSDRAAVSGAPIVLLVVPAQTMRDNVRALSPHLLTDQVVVSASKGLEIGSALRMSEVIAQEAAHLPPDRICALSGPNLAREVAARKPSVSVVAGRSLQAAEAVQALFTAPHFRLYTHTDVAGVELAGAIKNVIALGAGMCDGLGAGNNAKAALMTRGLAEMARLGRAVGAEPLTFSGLAGIGDLIATCTSPLSRNRTTGERLAQGQSLAQIQAQLKQVAEGIPTTRAVRDLAARHRVEMPIAGLMYQVLFEQLPILQAGLALMQRDPKRELDGIV
ncbi:MAG: NAD(P)H-dependent glycerol-3-phosphate dehydrogenase [Chloroflexota bacterium]